MEQEEQDIAVEQEQDIALEPEQEQMEPEQVMELQMVLEDGKLYVLLRLESLQVQVMELEMIREYCEGASPIQMDQKAKSTSLACPLRRLRAASPGPTKNARPSFCAGRRREVLKEMSGKKVRVVSMPFMEIFQAQPKGYREELLPKSVPKPESSRWTPER